MKGDRQSRDRSRTAPLPGVIDVDRLFWLLIGVYLGGGLLNSMVSLLVPRETVLLGLSNAEAMCVQLAYYSSYLLFALPMTMLVVRLGYMRSIAVGLCVMATGCLAFVAAQAKLSFALMLIALLVMSSGVTVLQVAGSAITRAFGERHFASRYTLLQGLNSLGTVAGPLISAHFLLGHDVGLRAGTPFLIIAGGLVLVACTFLLNHRLLPPLPEAAPSVRRLGRLLYDRRIQGGIVAIFAYVGAEVAVGTLAVAYLMLPGTIAAQATSAGRLVALYWGGAMVGRFAGAFLLRHVGAGLLLSGATVGAIVMLAIAILAQGTVGAVALLGVGLFNSVMFPLIYTLAQPDQEADAPATAMLLCMAVVGGAVVPVLAGAAADVAGLAVSLVVPMACYLVILAFGVARVRTA